MFKTDPDIETVTFSERFGVKNITASMLFAFLGCPWSGRSLRFESFGTFTVTEWTTNSHELFSTNYPSSSSVVLFSEQDLRQVEPVRTADLRMTEAATVKGANVSQ